MGNNSTKGGANDNENPDKFLKEIHRTDKDFELRNARVYLKEKNTTGFIAFYAPWCHFCVELAPSWNEYSKEMGNSSFKFLAVDCTSDECTSIVDNLNINSFPTIKYIDPETQEIVSADYLDGSSLVRSPEGILKFLRERKVL